MPTKFKEINWNPSLKERKDWSFTVIGFPFVALFWTLVLAMKGILRMVLGLELIVFFWIFSLGCTGLLCWSLPSCPSHLLPVVLFVCIIDTIITGLLLPTFFT